MSDTNHRDMDRDFLMDLGNVISRPADGVMPACPIEPNGPILWSGIGKNVGGLYVDLRLLGGQHVANYRLDWVNEFGFGELVLGDAVKYELAVAMYQELLRLITDNNPTHAEIRQSLLELEL